MKTLVKLEIVRVLRNRKLMFFSVIYPPVLFLLIAGPADSHEKVKGAGLTMPLYYMVAMAAFGAMSAVLLTNTVRIAQEREKGWVRQLRLTALPGHGYVGAKIAAAVTLSLPSIVLVMIVAAVAKDLRMEAWQWIAVLLCTWVGSFAFAALGVMIGYLVSADVAQPVVMILYFVLSLLGGLWMPFTIFPRWLRDIAEWLPTYRYAALGRAVEHGAAPHVTDIAVLAVYLVLFASAASWLYRRDTRKA